MALSDRLRNLSRATVASVAASHVVLLAAVLWGELPYLALQALLAAEIVVIGVATIPLYRGRSLGSHVRDTLSLTGVALFLLLFLALTYGTVSGQRDGNALAFSVDALASVDAKGYALGIGYVLVHALVALQVARASADPQRAWVNGMIADGTATLMAMFLMVFVGLLLGSVIVEGFSRLGAGVDAGAVLGILMVGVRFLVALVVAAMPSESIDAIAANPYA
ncbi:MAG TPA: hypothetical protein VND91_08325 [Candidatus Saccharimonadia bacterium]|nr:hypothetical protein [Candidatus Saccharimonadia bacterium]